MPFKQNKSTLALFVENFYWVQCSRIMLLSLNVKKRKQIRVLLLKVSVRFRVCVCSAVNFTNILQAAFAPISFCQENINLSRKYKKLLKRLLYKKAAFKMLVKLTPDRKPGAALTCDKSNE